MFPEWVATIPSSTFLILCLSALMAFLTSLITRLSTSREQMEQLRAWTREIAAWTSDFNKAKRTGDKKLLRKVQRQEKRIRQLEMKRASQSFRQMKTVPIFMILFILMWLPLTGKLLYWELFKGPFTGGETVAYLPWFGGVFHLNLIWWYFLCSFLFGTLFSRLLGVGAGATE